MDLDRDPSTIANTAAERAERLHRIRQAVGDSQIDGISAERLSGLLTGLQLPTSLEYALIADATGCTVDWLLHGIQEIDPEECVASKYVGVADSYNGMAFCGCPDCIEYVGERQYEDEV